MRTFKQWLVEAEKPVSTGRLDQTVAGQFPGGQPVKKGLGFAAKQAVGALVPGAELAMDIFEKAKEWWSARQEARPAQSALKRLQAYQKAHPDFSGYIEYPEELGAILNPDTKTLILEKLADMLDRLGDEPPHQGMGYEASLAVIGPAIQKARQHSEAMRQSPNINKSFSPTAGGVTSIPPEMMAKLQRSMSWAKP